MTSKIILYFCFLALSLSKLECYGIIEQLDALDEGMVKELDFNKAKTTKEQCVQPKLGYCKDEVSYPIAKAQSALHSFYDGLVESAMDTLTLETRGSVLSCKRGLKRVLCRDRFPKCSGGKVHWENGPEKCGQVLEKCPESVQDKLRQFNFCAKLNAGTKGITECQTPLALDDMKYCIAKKTDNVSPWNYHSAIEVNGLLDIQASLWNLSKQCINGLSSYLCFPAKSCVHENEAAEVSKKYNGLCKNAIKSCSNDVISRAVKDIFLNCEK